MSLVVSAQGEVFEVLTPVMTKIQVFCDDEDSGIL
jgi:hypothetical protein